MTLTDFLLTRIAEDEAIALRTRDVGFRGLSSRKRVLAECEAKRQVVEECMTAIGSENVAHGRGLSRAVRILALPYADHPDYREEWRA